ncbi:MAG: peptide ligase PGM1-related protein [Actinomycetota bacterium]|nr:peptide ligase PGM1-related protein [Actinomycetota bacterium]
MLDSGTNLTPGSPEEAAAFAVLQDRFPDVYRNVFSDPQAPRTVVVVPSMSLDERELAKIPGVIHYEERMLCLLMLLRLPRTQLIYVTSIDLDPAVIDYYLHLLPGIPSMHAQARLDLLSLNDHSLRPLSQKIVDHPERLAELKSLIRYPESAHMTCFNSTELERTLSVQLGVPLYACDPALAHLGNKSRSRSLFREIGLDLPDGFEDLRDRSELVTALTDLHHRNPELSRAVVKLNDGFSGEGNGVVPIHRLADSVSPKKAADRLLTDAIRFEAQDETWEQYESKLTSMGGIVEALIEDRRLTSPSVQMRIDPLGKAQLVSTHDQVLSGPSGQVYYGCTFPALDSYKIDLHEAGYAVADALNGEGVLGRFGVDFVSVPTENGWKHYAIEINLRKGGTTLPYLMLEYLTDGEYDPETGDFHTPTGEVRTYYATDNLVKDPYLDLTPSELIDAAVYEGIHYHATSQKGLVFHLLGAVTDFGKIGMVSIAEDRATARHQYDGAVATLDSTSAING